MQAIVIIMSLCVGHRNTAHDLKCFTEIHMKINNTQEAALAILPLTMRPE